MDFPQKHHTNDGRPVVVDRLDDGTLTFADGDTELARLVPEGSHWQLSIGNREQRTLDAAAGEPPITAAIVEIDLYYDEDDDTSGVEE